ncbi:MAG: RNA polymerase sporulation sigma factor SigH [Clostridia bacterium]|nr:RNA polymerase sporulation sigma factor SigH [Clostridia bacterium]
MAKGELAYSLNNDLKNKTDAELVVYAREGNETALEILLDKYKELINMKVGKYFIIGAEREDIIQEGMIGLYKAVKNFEMDKQNSFKSFANLCIERQLITAIKTSNRQKHIPLNSSVSLNTTVYDNDDDVSLMEFLNSNTVEDPLDTITKKEYYKLIGNKIDEHLSDFEKQVLSRFAAGDSYVKIAERLDTPVKSIDNAIQRIRKKANKNIINEE